MINTSNAYKRAIEKNREFRIRDRITFRDGTYADISMEDIMSYKINEATSSSGKFEIGAAVMKEYAITLSNMDGKFDLYDFEDADIRAVVGLKLADNTWEDLRKGTYRVFDTVFNDVTLQITAYDGMLFFDRPYSGCKLNYPATILEIIQSACQDCQMTFDASTVEMGNYIVAERPDDTSLTYRDMIAYCAQIMGRFARINHLGALSFGWYPFEVIPLGGLDGGYLMMLRRIRPAILLMAEILIITVQAVITTQEVSQIRTTSTIFIICAASPLMLSISA